MTWAAPWAWLLAAGIVLPIVAHLWSRRQPRAVPFPTLRFLQAASPVSRRLRHVQDWPLLVLRVVIVLLVAAAAARPSFTTAREGTPPLHRVIVVDHAVGAAAAPVIQRLRVDAAAVVLFEDVLIASVIPDAIAAARRTGRSARSEIVLVWDGTRPALDPADVEAIPAHVGVKLEPVRVAGDARQTRQPVSTLLGDIAAPSADVPARDRLLAALAAVRLPDTGIEVDLKWPMAPESRPRAARGPAPHTSRLYGAIDAIRADLRVREAAERSVYHTRRLKDDVLPGVGELVASTSDGQPLLGAAPGPSGLVVTSLASVSSPLTWWAAVSPLEALVPWERLASRQTPWSADLLRSTTRDAAAPTDELRPDRDTRLLWLLVLGLLLVEQWWRRHIARQEPQHAA